MIHVDFGLSVLANIVSCSVDHEINYCVKPSMQNVLQAIFHILRRVGIFL